MRRSFDETRQCFTLAIFRDLNPKRIASPHFAEGRAAAVTGNRVLRTAGVPKAVWVFMVEFAHRGGTKQTDEGSRPAANRLVCTFVRFAHASGKTSRSRTAFAGQLGRPV